MPRALLILPTATYRAPAFLDAARHLGVDVVTASEERQALADVMGDRFVQVPIGDPPRAADVIVDFAQRSPIDAVVAVDDQGALSAAMASQRLGLVHNAPDAVAATRDKAEMRRRLAVSDVAQPPFRILGGDDGPYADDVLDAAVELGYPVVVKPIGLSGSRGVIRADDEVDAVAAYERIGRLLDTLPGESRALIVESFIPGPEVAVEAILVAGEFRLLAIFDKPDPLDGPYFEETYYVTPSRHDPELQHRAVAIVADAAAALGLSDGPVHGEVRLGGGGALLEVAARTIGGRCAAALRFATGVSLEELVLRRALGDPLNDLPDPSRASGVMMLPTALSGTLVGVSGRDEAVAVPGVTALEIAIPNGRDVLALPEGSRYLGFLFATGDTPDEVEASLRAGFAELEITITPQKDEVGA